jgi:hypothetical protein
MCIWIVYVELCTYKATAQGQDELHLTGGLAEALGDLNGGETLIGEFGDAGVEGIEGGGGFDEAVAACGRRGDARSGLGGRGAEVAEFLGGVFGSGEERFEVCGLVIEFLGEAFAEFVEVGTKGVEFRDGGEVFGVDGGGLGAGGGALAKGPGEA